MAGEKRDQAQRSLGVATAAEALEAELLKFEELATAAEKVPLRSQKNVARAAQALHEAYQAHERAAVRLKELGDAIAAAQKRHEVAVGQAHAITMALESRQNDITALLERFAGLGREAQAINDLARSQQSTETRVVDLELLVTRLSGAVESARALRVDSDAAGVEDLTREADALRQQLQSVLNRIKLAAERIAGGREGAAD